MPNTLALNMPVEESLPFLTIICPNGVQPERESVENEVGKVNRVLLRVSAIDIQCYVQAESQRFLRLPRHRIEQACVCLLFRRCGQRDILRSWGSPASCRCPRTDRWTRNYDIDQLLPDFRKNMMKPWKTCVELGHDSYAHLALLACKA